MEQRELGRTGHRSTLVTFGTAGLGRVEQDMADKAIEAVLEHGVNHIHIAPSYGEAMECLAPWMPQIRDQDDIDRALWWSLSQPSPYGPERR
jgi:aryl-alcohol dehydrogenase-like predicted oxidoreductase